MGSFWEIEEICGKLGEQRYYIEAHLSTPRGSGWAQAPGRGTGGGVVGGGLCLPVIYLMKVLSS